MGPIYRRGNKTIALLLFIHLLHLKKKYGNGIVVYSSYQYYENNIIIQYMQ